MNREPVRGSCIVTEQDEPPARIRWDGGNRLDSDRLRGKFVFPPVQTLVRAKEDVIGRFFVIGHDENGTRVSELVEMGVLVNFLPREPSVATQESVAIRITSELFSDIPDGHDQARNGRSTERGSRIETFRISVEVKRAFLNRKTLQMQTGWLSPLFRTVVSHA